MPKRLEYLHKSWHFTAGIFFSGSIDKTYGDRKTDAAQRLSLFIPILAAWLLFKEDFNLKSAFFLSLTSNITYSFQKNENKITNGSICGSGWFD
jgi:hypothetical protein